MQDYSIVIILALAFGRLLAVDVNDLELFLAVVYVDSPELLLAFSSGAAHRGACSRHRPRLGLGYRRLYHSLTRLLRLPRSRSACAS